MGVNGKFSFDCLLDIVRFVLLYSTKRNVLDDLKFFNFNFH